jgi:hypothetical protein
LLFIAAPAATRSSLLHLVQPIIETRKIIGAKKVDRSSLDETASGRLRPAH